MDLKEEYIASCCDDGKVVIFGLLEANHDQLVEFNRPIKSIELDPAFSTSFSFVTGDTKLVLVERGFMGRRKTSVLHENEGLVRSIKWNDDLIAWSNDKGVKIYSIVEKRIITFITKDHDARLRNELYRCCLLWTNADTLLIGWGDRFKICKVMRRTFGTLPTNTKASKAISALAGSVLHNAAGNFATGDKKDLGTHVEISNLFLAHKKPSKRL
jgi:hypothetical protein